MQIGMVGLGKMGGNMTKRLVFAGHEVVVYDRTEDAVTQAVDEGAIGSNSLEDLVAKLDGPQRDRVRLDAGIR